MAVNPADFYINQADIDTRIDTLVTGIQSRIDTMITYLVEDSTTHYISVNSSDRTNYNSNLNLLKSDFSWYGNLGGLAKVYSLKAAFVDDYSGALKPTYVVEQADVININGQNSYPV